ncbi:MAG: DUF3536 domain-containing protein, partial [Acidimicrobiia bacterium]
MPTTFVVHAHFYQPPRENPWTEEVPRELSAAPFHDWNTRISAECYRPNAFARIVDGEGRVLDIVNNYQRLSFNAGPTLMSWLERHRPVVYERIREAAAGGGAIAQAWNHMILPLASERDARTQVRWGLADFRHRFGTEAQGMWLPETAVNDATLAVLAEEGVGFTVLAPTQARAVRPLAGVFSSGPAAVLNQEWQAQTPGGIDTRLPYRWCHPQRPRLGVDVVFYDGPLSHDLAFSSLSSEALAERAAAAGGRRGGLVAVALDGETFGHHHKWMDRALAYALTTEGPRRGLQVSNLASWLAVNRPTREVAVWESAWSCAHGVGRWVTDCGCATGGPPGCDQRWRTPLRAALDLLRDFGVEAFCRRGEALFHGDPWAVRDAYVEVLLGAVDRCEFARRHIRGDATEAFTLLEAQRNAMLMYTSCGWFFHDLAGLETVQVLRYAARSAELLEEAGEVVPRDAFGDVLGRARSHAHGDGRRVWSDLVLPARVDAPRVAAHLVLCDLFGLGDGEVGGFAVSRVGAGEVAGSEAGVSLAWRRLRLVARRTGRIADLVAAALRTGESDATGVVVEDGATDAVALERLGTAVTAGASVAALGAALRAVGEPVLSFGSDALLPEAAEELMERASAALMRELAASAEPFLEAARWAALSRPAGAGDAGDAVLLGEPLRGLAEAAALGRVVDHLAAGETGAAADLARRA